MAKISPVTQIAMRKNQLFQQTLKKNQTAIPTTNRGRLLAGSLAALAILGSALTPFSCSKEVIYEKKTTQNSLLENINKHLNTLGLLLDNNSFEDIKNISFNENEAEHIIEPNKLSENYLEIKYTQKDKNNIVNSEILNLKAENNFLLLEDYNIAYAIENDNIIEYALKDNMFIPKSKFSKTDKGFRQDFHDGRHKDFDNIKNNAIISGINIVVDDSLNEIVHEIVLN